MAPTSYASPAAGLPPQAALHTQRAVFTEAYALIPRGVMRDIVTSYLPHWTDTRAWIIARPLSGFAETFSQYVVEVAPGSDPTNDADFRRCSVLTPMCGFSSPRMQQEKVSIFKTPT